MKVKNISKVSGPMPISDPYIMGVHHYDKFPKGNGEMGPNESLSGRKKGNDFNPENDWRMYHGEKIPGFPHHPHRGFEIISIVPEGFADHFDSKGSKGRYGQGDVQLMSAGSGVLHSEMFPLVNDDKENPLRLFQIWLNLPGKNKLTDPDYKMIWKENLPEGNFEDKNGANVNVKVVLGEYQGVKSVDPLKNSWAADPNNHVGIAMITLDPNTTFTLPNVSSTMKRYVLFYDGKSTIDIDSYKLQQDQLADLMGDQEIEIINGDSPAKILILEGEPINEPVAAYGPFVMNTQQELQEAFNEYRKTEFGGWPWGDKESDLVNPKDAGRFASYDFDKVIDKPAV
ncbi:pirin family protein [Algoriella sp.]|uniref:pirin family protein n=1 Tax=Algoriella sp. TaxID=1872434 RepID=UPI002FCC5EFE